MTPRACGINHLFGTEHEQRLPRANAAQHLPDLAERRVHSHPHHVIRR
jgi:hypothetical protein